MLGFSNREIQSFSIFLCDKYSVTRFSNWETVINIQYFLFVYWMDSVIRRSSYLELILFRFYRWQVHVGMPPFSTHRFVHTTMIILDFTREWVPSTERDDSCVFCNFLCFEGCLVNCFSSNTPCTCLDLVIGRSSYSIFFMYIHYFFHIFFLWLGTFFLYFFPIWWIQ